MPVSKKANEKKKAQQVKGNFFAAIEDNDGNPRTANEFDAEGYNDGETFFVAVKGASDDDKTRCKILNYIHKNLFVNMERSIPADAVGADDKKTIEIYHRAKFEGIEIDICVYWPGEVDDKGRQQAVAMAKLKDQVITDDTKLGGAVTFNAGRTSDAKADKFNKKALELTKFYWAPRWKYVATYLRARMGEDFDKHGVEIERPVEVSEDEAAGDDDDNSKEEIEEQFDIFFGCTGAIIGPKGSKIKEIRDASGVKDIQMPPKDESGGERPRARDLTQITLKGTKGQINKAKVLIQAVKDEWANKPREPRGGSGGAAEGSLWAAGGDAGGAAEDSAWANGSTADAGIVEDNGWEGGAGASSGGW